MFVKTQTYAIINEINRRGEITEILIPLRAMCLKFYANVWDESSSPDRDPIFLRKVHRVAFHDSIGLIELIKLLERDIRSQIRQGEYRWNFPSGHKMH